MSLDFLYFMIQLFYQKSYGSGGTYMFIFPEANIDYTKNEQLILHFITENPTLFLSMSITQLATKLSVSDATISRFAKHCGYKDYKDLKLSIANQLEHPSPAAKMQKTLKEDSASELQSFVELQQLHLQKTLELIDMNAFRQSIHHITCANHIYIHAKGASKSLADLLLFRLNRFGQKVILLPSGGSEIFERLGHIKKDDVIIMFPFQRISKEDQVLLKYGKKTEAKTILFTSQLYSKWDSYCTAQLYIYRGEPNEYHSMTAAMAVLDALIVSIFAELEPSASSTLEHIHQLKKEYSEDIPR